MCVRVRERFMRLHGWRARERVHARAYARARARTHTHTHRAARMFPGCGKDVLDFALARVVGLLLRPDGCALALAFLRHAAEALH